MRASESTQTETVGLRMRPDESMAEFIARVREARGPLTPEELGKLRKIFAPGAGRNP